MAHIKPEVARLPVFFSKDKLEEISKGVERFLAKEWITRYRVTFVDQEDASLGRQ